MWMVALYLRECRKTENISGYKLDKKISENPPCACMRVAQSPLGLCIQEKDTRVWVSFLV